MQPAGGCEAGFAAGCEAGCEAGFGAGFGAASCTVKAEKHCSASFN